MIEFGIEYLYKYIQVWYYILDMVSIHIMFDNTFSETYLNDCLKKKNL